MIVRIELLSDGIFGSGQSVPGMEDISVIHDDYGFPYLSGSNFKGNLRETVENILTWTGQNEEVLSRLFGKGDGKGLAGNMAGQLIISDFNLPLEVRQAVLEELQIKSPEDREIYMDYVLDLFSEIRTFTALDDNVAKTGSLRTARCICEGLVFYGQIEVPNKDDETLLKEALGQMKWLGTMRTRGFGQVRVSAWEEDMA